VTKAFYFELSLRSYEGPPFAKGGPSLDVAGGYSLIFWQTKNSPKGVFCFILT